MVSSLAPRPQPRQSRAPGVVAHLATFAHISSRFRGPLRSAGCLHTALRGSAESRIPSRPPHIRETDCASRPAPPHVALRRLRGYMALNLHRQESCHPSASPTPGGASPGSAGVMRLSGPPRRTRSPRLEGPKSRIAGGPRSPQTRLVIERHLDAPRGTAGPSRTCPNRKLLAQFERRLASHRTRRLSPSVSVQSSRFSASAPSLPQFTATRICYCLGSRRSLRSPSKPSWHKRCPSSKRHHSFVPAVRGPTRQ
jgi:hypothetical protein